jgi:hypothetical protein
MGKLTEMTLSEVIPGARRLSIVEKLQLIQILAKDLDISPLEPFKTYDVQDRCNDFGAARVLMEILDRWRSLSSGDSKLDRELSKLVMDNDTEISRLD